MARATRITIRPVRQVWTRDVFLQIEWRRFEAVIEALFAQAGFETKAQTHGADSGVDVWLYAKGKPNEPLGIVHCITFNSSAGGNFQLGVGGSATTGPLIEL